MSLFDKLKEPIFLKEQSDAQYYISKLKDLYDNAPDTLKGKIENEIKFTTLGEFGEQSIAFELKNSGMPMYVLHDIYLEVDGLSAQIDYIVVTRKVIFVIECKNLIGNIEVDNQGNFIRSYKFNGRQIKEGIYSPITQNQRHLEVIKKIKRASKSSTIAKVLFDKYFDDNYKSIVVLANPKTLLNSKYAQKEVRNKVIRGDQLINYIKQVNDKSNVASSSDKQMKDIAEKFLNLHKVNKSDYSKKYTDLIEAFNNKEIDNNKEIHNNIKGNAEDILIENLNKEELKDAHINDTAKNKDEELIKRLKEFRIQKSREEKIKPYFIFNDKQMLDLISKMPKTKVELMEISGFGEVKVEKYGESILKIIKE